MTIIACVDNRNGIAFNRRRLSSDKAVTEKILKLTTGMTLRITPYSTRIFEQVFSTKPIARELFPLSSADHGDAIFIDADFPELNELQKADISKLILFKWNRDYPSDVKFDYPNLLPDFSNWTLTETEDFPGHSHETITMEVYEHHA